MSQQPPAPPTAVSRRRRARRAPPVTFTRTLQIRLNTELYERLGELRSRRAVNVSAWLRMAITRALDREMPKSGAKRRSKGGPKC